MKIAVAVNNDFRKVAGHAGRARTWLVFEADETAIAADPGRIELAAEMVFHHFKDDAPHPLDGIDAIIAISAGDGFIKHMGKRGITVALTAETNPAKAAADYLAQCLAAPKPRPIGALICKTLDLFSKH